jgi:hypothetical protein
MEDRRTSDQTKQITKPKIKMMTAWMALRIVPKSKRIDFDVGRSQCSHYPADFVKPFFDSLVFHINIYPSIHFSIEIS